MKSKHLLLTLLLALFVPWAAMAQSTLPVCNGTTTTTNVPIRSGYGTQSEFIYPASMLSDMEGGTISSVKFFSSATTTSNYTNNVTVYVEEVASATESSSSWSYNQATATKVYEGTTLSVTNGELVITFSSPYQYNGGNLCFNIWAATSAPSVSFYYQDQSYTCAGWDWSITPPVTKPYRTGSSLPKAEFTYTPDSNPCKKPTLAEATLTQGNGNVASLTWTEKGEAEGWVLQYGTDNTFATGSYTERTTGFDVSGTTVTANLTGLTPEQKLYARVKPDCDTDGTKWSNVIEFKPTNTIPQTVCDGTAPGTTAATNGFIPVYGGYAENYNKDEFIIPATTEGMANMASGTISEMTFYLSSPADDLWGNALYRVFMKEVNESAFANNSYYGTDGATIVYEGALDGTHSTMTIEFTTDYEYNGGNLLIGIYEYYKGSWKSVVFDGIESTNGSMYKNNSTSLESITTGNLQNFIPKTTFTYLPSATPKPRNLQVSDISSSSAKLTWEAPATANPTGYKYRYSRNGGVSWTSWLPEEELIEGLTYTLNLDASTTYIVEVKAIYAGGGESAAIQTEFTTLDDCAYPTNLLAYTVAGQGTKATLTWRPGYDETHWVLQYATNADFTEGLVEKTTGFVTQVIDEVTYIACPLTGLTAETHYYARVKANCDGTTSAWSNVAEFTPTNYKDFTFGQAASYTSSYVPFYGYYASSSPLLSQFIIPSSDLADVAGGTIRRMTFHSSTASANWGAAEFSVYVKEVEATSFASSDAAGLEDWSSMTNVYNGSLSISGNQMVIEFENNFAYNGGNLMIGFNETTTGTAASVNWYYVSGPSYSTLYAYYYYGSTSYGRGSSLPKVTFNYQPTATPRPIITVPVTTTDVTATIAWTKPSDNVTGYKYQYKLASATEWPTSWTELNDANAVSVTVPNLTPNTSYDFQIKAVYAEGESVASSTSFATTCPAATAVPYSYGFETAPEFNCWEVTSSVSNGVRRTNSYAHVGNYSLVFYGTQLNEIEMPLFNQPTNTLRMEYWVRPEGYTDSRSGSFAIGYYNANDEFVALKTYEFNTTTGRYDDWESTVYIKQSIYFDVDADNDGTPDVPADAHIVFRQFNPTSNYYWMVDDVKVKVIPTCEDVDNVTASNVTNHSATIAWTADAAQAAWQIAYKAGANFDPYNAEELATATIVDVTSNPYLFDKNLEAATTYYMYVRGDCTASSNGYGDWSDSYATFTTLAATPAPSNFVASNPASEKVDLVWTAGGGDYELSWDLYYVQSDDAPTAPTEETPATKTVTTLPTTENPYELSGLDPESRYYIWVRANHTNNSVTTHSAWVALTGNFFETLSACPTPYDLEIANITSVSADLWWTGSVDVDNYTVEYGEEGTYSINETEDFSGQTPAGYNAAGELPEGWYAYNTSTSGTYYMPHVSDKSNYNHGGISSSFESNDNFLLLTTNQYSSTPSANQYVYAIMPQYSDLASVSFDYVYESTSYGTLSVGYVTDNLGYSTYQVLQTPEKKATKTTYTLTATDIATINSNNGYIAFCYASGSSTFYAVAVDNVTVKGGTYTPAPTQQVTTAAEHKTLTDLTPNKTYLAKVKSNCTNGEWSAPITFTTLPDGTKVFTNATHDGMWGTAGNWAPTGAPAITDNVIIRANDTIASGVVAEAKKITFEGSSTLFLVIADGGQLKTDNSVAATVKKTFTGYGTGNEADADHYYLIANPFSSTSTPTYDGIITSPATTYDLYQWSRTAYDGNEWRNYKKSTFSLTNGSGYLYANANTVTFSNNSTVKANNTAQSVSVSYTAPSGSNEFSDWNLLGNPFVCNAYLVSASENGTALPYYKMNEAGNGFEAVTGDAIAPMQGIFYQATAAGAGTVYFTRTAPSAKISQLNMNLSRNNEQLDNAILVFGGNQQMGKFSFRANSSKIYMPVEGKDFAIVSTESNIGEMPLSFEAEKNGSYTLSFTSEEVSFAYLHLIDNMTGIETDLLANPSYSFEARTTDYESRFKLVFATGSSTGSDTFAYYSNGNWVINNEGRAMLQVVDVNGRILKSESINGCANINFKAAAGVYVIRLVNGDNVKVQKVVVK